MDTDYDSEPFTSAEMEQILAGRATPDELLERRHAARQRDAAQLLELHAIRANPELGAVMDRMTALEAVNENLTHCVSMLEARVPIVPADRKALYLGRAKNGCSR